MGLSEENYFSQAASAGIDTPDYSYAKKEHKCICKQTHNRIPRPRNAFILFRQKYHRSVFDESNESKTNPQVSQELGRRWRALSVKERDHWNTLAEEERQEHAKKYPNYRYTPRRKGKFKHCQVCYGKKDTRAAARPGKRAGQDSSLGPAPPAAGPLMAKAAAAQLSLYPYTFQPLQQDVSGVKAPPQGDLHLQNGMSHAYLGGLQAQPPLQQAAQARLGARAAASHPPLDSVQYMSFAQSMYPPLNQYGYMENNYILGSHVPAPSALQTGSALSMHAALVSRRSSVLARPANSLDYESLQTNEGRMQLSAAASNASASSSEGYPMPTLMQQYLVSFNKTALKKVS